MATMTPKGVTLPAITRAVNLRVRDLIDIERHAIILDRMPLTAPTGAAPVVRRKR